MTKKSILIISAIFLVIFILAIGYFIFTISISVRNGKVHANFVFDSLTKEINNIVHYSEQNNLDYSDSIDALIKGNNLISTFSIQNNSKLFYTYSKSNQQANSIKKTPLTQVFSTSIPFYDNSTANLTVSIYILQPRTIFNVSRNVFITILICIVIIFILIFAIKTNDNNSNSEIIEENDANTTKKQFEWSFNNLNVEKTEPNPIYKDNLEFEEADELEPIPDEPNFEEVQAITVKKEEPVLEEIPTMESEENTTKNSDDKINSMGLFSNTSGFGWESYLQPRLDAELVRASSSEQDLSLIVIRIKDINNTENLLSYVTSILLDSFKFRDLVFEFQNDGFVGILQNSDIEKALEFSKNLYQTISNILKEKDLDNKVAIGISSKTLRLVPAERIIKEATLAAEKAFDETELPIVAFKVNPEKYRNYLTN